MYFFAKIAHNNSLNSEAAFSTKLLPKVKTLCQDFNWEIRKEICLHIHYISSYIENPSNILLTDLVELTDDEEIEVKTCAIKALVKHMLKIFQPSFCKSQTGI
jgi:hypothetical protein